MAENEVVNTHMALGRERFPAKAGLQPALDVRLGPGVQPSSSLVPTPHLRLLLPGGWALFLKHQLQARSRRSKATPIRLPQATCLHERGNALLEEFRDFPEASLANPQRTPGLVPGQEHKCVLPLALGKMNTQACCIQRSSWRPLGGVDSSE